MSVQGRGQYPRSYTMLPNARYFVPLPRRYSGRVNACARRERRENLPTTLFHCSTEVEAGKQGAVGEQTSTPLLTNFSPVLSCRRAAGDLMLVLEEAKTAQSALQAAAAKERAEASVRVSMSLRCIKAGHELSAGSLCLTSSYGVSMGGGCFQMSRMTMSPSDRTNGGDSALSLRPPKCYSVSKKIQSDACTAVSGLGASILTAE